MIRFPKKLEPLFKPSRYKELHGGRGGAKSWGVARALLLQGAKDPLRILCAREFQNSIKDSVLKLLSDQIEDMGLSSFYDVQTQAIKGKNGTEFAFEGLRQNVTRIKSYEAVDRVWIEEAQTVSKNSWDILIPTIRKDGSEIWLTWNPEFEDDETYRRFIQYPPNDCIHIEINWRDNPWFPKVLEQEKADLKARDPDAYDHVWEGKCRQWLEGAIYARELRKAYEDNRIAAVGYDSAVPVFTAWDLGHTDDTAIWWYQVVAGEIHILESYASSGGSLSEYATQILGRPAQIDLVDEDVVLRLDDEVHNKELKEMAATIKYRRHYKYRRHWLPHDAKAKTLAAKGKSIIQQLAAALDLSNLAIVPDIGVEDGIQAARMMFGRCWFDANGCDPGLKALRRYQREKQQDDRSFKKIPKHDWTSHYADAFRMLAVATQNEVRIEEKAKTKQTEVRGLPSGAIQVGALEELYNNRPRQLARI